MAGFIIVLVLAALILYAVRRKKKPAYVLGKQAKSLLSEHVLFYSQLSNEHKKQFELRVADFLTHVRITGIGTDVSELDRLLVASGAIIPIFSFSDWRYRNISEVLLYNTSFSKDYRTEGEDRNVLGMVGEGAMNGQMILSKPSLRSSFQNQQDGHNTVIHEFVHLIDKADGEVDGVPEYLLSKPYIIPWIKAMHRAIKEMKTGETRDINLYGATNDAEFFAVVSEYFFEKPAQLQQKHPELYAMMEQMFRPPEQ